MSRTARFVIVLGTLLVAACGDEQEVTSGGDVADVVDGNDVGDGGGWDGRENPLDSGDDGGTGPETGTAEVAIETGGTVAEETTIDGENGGTLVLPQALAVSTSEGEPVAETLVVSFSDSVAAPAVGSLSPATVFEVGAWLGDDGVFLYFGEERDPWDISPRMSISVTLPGALLGDPVIGRGVHLFRDLDDFEEPLGDGGTADWSYLGLFIVDADGDLTVPVSHVGAFAAVPTEGFEVEEEESDSDGRGEAPPEDGYELSYTIDGDVHTFVIIEPTTAEILVCGVYWPEGDDPSQGEWQCGGSPDQAFYYQVLDNGDGTSTLLIHSEYSNQPMLRIRNTDGELNQGLMDPPRVVAGGVTGAEAIIDPFSPRAGFLLVNITGTGSFGDAKDIVAKLKEMYGEENVIVDYFHLENGEVFMNVRVRNSGDGAFGAANNLQAYGVYGMPFGGAISDTEEVSPLNSNYLMVSLSPPDVP